MLLQRACAAREAGCAETLFLLGILICRASASERRRPQSNQRLLMLPFREITRKDRLADVVKLDLRTSEETA